MSLKYKDSMPIMDQDFVRRKLHSIYLNIDAILSLRDKYKKEGRKIKPENCVLRHEGHPFYGHYSASELLAGGGCYMWNCPICGEEFQE